MAKMNGKVAKSKSTASGKKAPKRVYFFGNGKAEGGAHLKDLLGGKGANLADMTLVPLPCRPASPSPPKPAANITTRARNCPTALWTKSGPISPRWKRRSGKKFGDAANPLLVAARSGAKMSMPGMMDTVLNIGLSDAVSKGWPG